MSVNRNGRVLQSALAIGLGLLSACGNGNGASPSPLTSVIAEGSFAIGTLASSIANNDPCEFAQFIHFNTSTSGTLEAIVDWTFASNDVNFVITRGQCTCNQLANAPTIAALDQVCPSAGIATSANKPERLSIANHPPGAYTLLVYNSGNQSDSGSYQLLLTQR